MMTKYTPGPWTFSRDIWWENTPGDQERHGGLIVWPAANEDLTIAEVNDFFDGDEGRANARLMAAAPELYEACEEFVRKCECAENFVAKVEKALDNDAAVCWRKYFLSEEARRGGEGVQK